MLVVLTHSYNKSVRKILRVKILEYWIKMSIDDNYRRVPQCVTGTLWILIFVYDFNSLKDFFFLNIQTINSINANPLRRGMNNLGNQ